MSGAPTAEAARAKTEQQLLHSDVEVRKLVLDAVAKGVPGLDISNPLVTGEVNRTIQGASQVTLTVHDQARTIFKNRLLTDDDGDLRAIDVHLDGLWFRLVKVQKQGDDVVLIFEDRDVSYLRDKKGPRALGSRARMTRAEAILALIRSVKIHRIPVRINELHKKQPIAKLTQAERDKETQAQGGSSSKGGEMLIEGDSLAVGSNLRVKQLLGSGWRVSSDSAIGRTTAQGLARLQSRTRLPNTLLIELGTNDDPSAPEAFRTRVRSVMDLAGSSKKVYWVNLTRQGGGPSFTPLNTVLDEEENNYQNLTVIRWAHFVDVEGIELDADLGVHPDAAGYKKRGSLIANAIGPVRRPKDGKSRDKSEEDKKRSPGFPKGLKIKDVTEDQLEVIAECLTVGEGIKNVGEREMLTMLVAGFGESGFDPSKVDFDTGTHKGVFQSNQIPQYNTKAQAFAFFTGGPSFRDGAIKAIREHPTWTVGRVAEWVEVSGAGAAFYDKFFKTARKVLDAWGGTGDSDGVTTVTYRKQYVFKVQKKENYWDAIQRMASEVNWRAFFTSGTFYYISEEDLFRSRPRYRLSEGDDGVINIDFDHDKRKKVFKATATVRIDRWAIPPGITIQLRDLGPANGRWLVESITRNLFSAEATVELKKPQREKLEPRTDLVTHKKTKGSNSSGGGANDIASANGVAPPLRRILEHSNGYNPPAHDGVDLICGANVLIYAICDAKVVDVRSGGWWGKSPTGDVSIGDGIIQLECLVDSGPFKKGLHFGYGHAEHALVKVGDRVQAGQAIGHAGFANAWHVHFMANGGSTLRGTGDRDPWPYVAYAMRNHNISKTDPDYEGANP